MRESMLASTSVRGAARPCRRSGIRDWPHWNDSPIPATRSTRALPEQPNDAPARRLTLAGLGVGS
jgi:hypothetical protein